MFNELNCETGRCIWCSMLVSRTLIGICWHDYIILLLYYPWVHKIWFNNNKYPIFNEWFWRRANNYLLLLLLLVMDWIFPVQKIDAEAVARAVSKLCFWFWNKKKKTNITCQMVMRWTFLANWSILHFSMFRNIFN